MYAVTGSGRANMNGVTLEVVSGASLSLQGSFDTVFLDNGASGVTLTGDGNRIMGTAANNTTVFINSGSKSNGVSVGSGSQVIDYGFGDTISAGANSSVFLMGSSTVNANNSHVETGNSFSSGTLNGNSNQLEIGAGGSINLSGSGNSVSAGGGVGPDWVVSTGTTSSVAETNGTIVLTGDAKVSSVLNNGTWIVQLDNGNTVTVANAQSAAYGGSLTTDNQVTQLVSGMATYAVEGAAGISSTLGQPSAEPNLFASAHV